MLGLNQHLAIDIPLKIVENLNCSLDRFKIRKEVEVLCTFLPIVIKSLKKVSGQIKMQRKPEGTRIRNKLKNIYYFFSYPGVNSVVYFYLIFKKSIVVEYTGTN